MRRVLIALALLASLATARAAEVTIALPDGTSLRAELFRPTQPSPRAAVIVLHGCGGPYPVRDDPWRDAFLAEGRVVLRPLSFASRGLGSQCSHPNAQASPYTTRRDDTIAAARWLVAQDFTPKGGVVVMGFSHGGSTTLAAAGAMPDGLVRGYVALYPGCGTIAKDPGWTPRAPLAIFIGDSDDWTRPAPCQRLADRLPGKVSLTLYTDAYHDFDAPDPVRIRQGSAGSWVHVGNNPAARRAVYQAVPAFLATLP